jgi:hypothetical protein
VVAEIGGMLCESANTELLNPYDRIDMDKIANRKKPASLIFILNQA